MYEQVEKPKENKSRAVANSVAQKNSSGKQGFGFVDNRPQAKQAAQFQAMTYNCAAQQLHSIQKKENNTGLPDNLKSGIENLSGYSMDDVKVHYNSNKPTQLIAHAYAQGTNIHIASGQEKHLPREAWHMVQQRQGRVKPTIQLKNKGNRDDDNGSVNVIQRLIKYDGDNGDSKEKLEAALTVYRNNEYAKRVIDFYEMHPSTFSSSAVYDYAKMETGAPHLDAPSFGTAGSYGAVHLDTPSASASSESRKPLRCGSLLKGEPGDEARLEPARSLFEQGLATHALDFSEIDDLIAENSISLIETVYCEIVSQIASLLPEDEPEEKQEDPRLPLLRSMRERWARYMVEEDPKIPAYYKAFKTHREIAHGFLCGVEDQHWVATKPEFRGTYGHIGIAYTDNAEKVVTTSLKRQYEDRVYELLKPKKEEIALVIAEEIKEAPPTKIAHISGKRTMHAHRIDWAKGAYSEQLPEGVPVVSKEEAELEAKLVDSVRAKIDPKSAEIRHAGPLPKGRAIGKSEIQDGQLVLMIHGKERYLIYQKGWHLFLFRRR